MNAVSFQIVEKVGTAAVLEQLAEESAELTKAALKLARIERHQNPTPVKYEDAHTALLEEIADVRVCLDVLEDALGDLDTTDIELEKIRRWRKRLNEFYDPAPERVDGYTSGDAPAE